MLQRILSEINNIILKLNQCIISQISAILKKYICGSLLSSNLSMTRKEEVQMTRKEEVHFVITLIRRSTNILNFY